LNADAATFYDRVAHVIDGDMLDVMVEAKRIRIRILDVDAPEHAQPYGLRSRQSLIALCVGEAAQVDWHKHDRNGRLLAYVRCNGSDAGAEQVRQGMALGLRALCAVRLAAVRDRSRARAARRGLWATAQPVPPWEWRKHQ